VCGVYGAGGGGGRLMSCCPRFRPVKVISRIKKRNKKNIPGARDTSHLEPLSIPGSRDKSLEPRQSWRDRQLCRVFSAPPAAPPAALPAAAVAAQAPARGVMVVARWCGGGGRP
jgi:hypothetical protein